jgi:hypothetical protein
MKVARGVDLFKVQDSKINEKVVLRQGIVKPTAT